MPVNWNSPSAFPQLTPQLADWLLNTGSLTERLQALTTSFDVELLGQSEMPIAKNEAAILSDSNDINWQIREVILQGRPSHANKRYDWVFARSILPSELCDSKWANLGKQPLGQRIFNDASFVRSEFEIGQLQFHPITGNTFDNKQPCWARRSKFTIDEFELIVAEAFLPDAPCYW